MHRGTKAASSPSRWPCRRLRPWIPRRWSRPARALRSGRKVLLLLAGRALQPQAQQLAWRIASATGARLMADFVNPTVPRGRGACKSNACRTRPSSRSRCWRRSSTSCW
jgi:hypothetical protein